MKTLTLLLLMMSWAAAQTPSAETLTVQAPDGVALQMTLWRGKTAPKSGWLLLHGYQSVKEEWEPLAKSLAGQGVAVALLDLRGHGKSGGTFRDLSKIAGDLEAALRVVREQTHLPESKLGIGGASIGANLAMLYAPDHANIAAVILLSPGLDYGGLKIEKAFTRYAPRPLFMAASPGDNYAFASVQQLARQRRDPALRLKVGIGAAHGVQMLNRDFQKSVEQWMLDLNAARKGEQK